MTLQRLFKAAGVAARLIRSGQSDELRHVIRNRWNGLDLDFVSVEQLGLSPERSEPHSASRAPMLRRVFNGVGVPPGSVVLDFGSGKGGAVIALAGLPFDEVIGVEISPELIRVAERNAARLGLRRVRFVQSDAAEYTDLDRVTHIFMFNPFTCPVVARVLANLEASLTRVPRPLCLVYRHPICHATLLASGLFQVVREIRPEPVAWGIYRHEPALWNRQGHPATSAAAESSRLA